MLSSDEDVKIYLGEESAPIPVSEGETSAAQFIRHKENGNLNKTRQLGQLLAQMFVGQAARFQNDPYGNQKLVLISFLAVDALERGISDQILQKSALSVFRETVDKLNSAIYQLMVDSTAYTLYILNDRQGCLDCNGKTLAELCGVDDDRQLIESGNALTAEYCKLFDDIISGYHFA